MIARIWHGWTTLDDAFAYQTILLKEVIPEIEAMHLEGFRSIQVLRRRIGSEVEFITIMRFDSTDDIVKFTGEDYERAHVPPQARAVLKRFDERAQHYNIVEELSY